MASQYSSDKKTIGQLLSTTSPAISVPEYQRNYSWTTTQVEVFWQDLMSFAATYVNPNRHDDGQEYFLGSIVLVEDGHHYELLDGQQRLATATILLSVIRDYELRYKGDAATRTEQKYIKDFDDATGDVQPRLTLNVYDRDYFRREIQERLDPNGDAAEPTMTSHRLIKSAKDFFQKQFDQAYQARGGGQEAFRWAVDLQHVLTDHVSVVAVTSKDEDNAATVFETLNDRGIGLSTTDLLRNLLLRRAPASDRDEIISAWRDVLEVVEDTKVEDFLRDYWLSHEGDVKTRSLYREIKQKVTTRGTNSLILSRDLQQTANLYRDLINGRDDDKALARLLQAIKMLGAGVLMPAILSAYAIGDVTNKARFLQALISLFVRYNAIGGRESSRLETVVYNVAKQLREDKDFEGAIKQLQDLAPTDEQFTDQFKKVIVKRRETQRYILRELEFAKRQTGEVDVEQADRVHVEHIYPQNPEQGKKSPYHELLVDRIGNLTLLSSRLNEKLRNSDFELKKLEYVRSDLLLTKGLLDYGKWDADMIDRRQAELSELAPAIWSFPPSTDKH